MAKEIIMYASGLCGFCHAAKRLLDKKGWEYETRSVDGNPELRAESQKLSGRTSVPQIFIGDTHVGGFDDLSEMEESGELDKLYES